MMRSRPFGSPIRCLYLVSSLEGGGAESQLHTFVLAARTMGVDPQVCALKHGGVLESRFKESGITPTILAGGFVSHVIKVAAMVKQGGFDCIHAHMLYSGMVGRIVKLLTGVPLVVTEHGLGRWKSRPLIWLDRATSRWVNMFITVSQASADIRKQRERHPEYKVRVIPNGVDVGRFASNNGRNGASSADPNVVHIGVVARLTPIKGIDRLLEAFYQVKSRNSDVVLHIVGNGPNEATLRKWVEDRRLDQSVVFHGWQADVRPFLHSWDIFVLPSMSEDLPVSLLEAMACGLPAVCSRVGGVPEIIRDGENGFLYEPTDTERLAAILLDLAHNPNLRDSMGHLAQQTVREQFSIDACVRKNVEVYSGLV